MDARPRERDPLLLGEHLGEVLPVEAGVRARGQLHHSGRHARVDRMGRAPASVA